MYNYDLLTSLYIMCFEPKKLGNRVLNKLNKLKFEKKKWSCFYGWKFTSKVKADMYEISPVNWEMPKDKYYINDFCCLLTESRLAFNANYEVELYELINKFISLSKIHTVGIVFYSDGVNEQIEGVYSCSEYIKKLKQEEISINTLYLIRN